MRTLATTTSWTTAVISLNVSGLPSSASDVHFSCRLWLKLRRWREKHQAAQAFWARWKWFYVSSSDDCRTADSTLRRGGEGNASTWAGWNTWHEICVRRAVLKILRRRFEISAYIVFICIHSENPYYSKTKWGRKKYALTFKGGQR